jgi:hypothetical protein
VNSVGLGCRTAPYLNNIIEQDHRFIKMRVTASLGFRSAEGAWRTIEGYEAMHAIRKGQVRWVAKGDSRLRRALVSIQRGQNLGRHLPIETGSGLFDFAPSFRLSLVGRFRSRYNLAFAAHKTNLRLTSKW